MRFFITNNCILTFKNFSISTSNQPEKSTRKQTTRLLSIFRKSLATLSKCEPEELTEPGGKKYSWQ
jgi:hypothetical protein